MIARLDVRLRPEALRARMREAVRREVASRAVDALAQGETGASPPDEKLTTDEFRDGVSRDV